MSTQDKTPVLITGAASGIGAAVARVLAREGYDLVLWDIDAKGLQLIQASLADIAPAISIETRAIDLADLGAITRAAQSLAGTYSAIRGLVHAAGIDGASPLPVLSPELWQRTLDINLRPLPFLTQTLLDAMRRCDHAAVVAIASINATQAHAANPAYSASKGGMLSLVRSLADELGQHGIRINSVSPGHIETAMTKPVLDAVPEIRDNWQRAFLGRLGQPEEVAEVVEFLLSERSSFMTASELVVDGGKLPSQR